MKLSDGSVKTVTAAAAGHLSKPGTTTLRMTGGVITAASSTPSSASTGAANQQQASFTIPNLLFYSAWQLFSSVILNNSCIRRALQVIFGAFTGCHVPQ